MIPSVTHFSMEKFSFVEAWTQALIQHGLMPIYEIKKWFAPCVLNWMLHAHGWFLVKRHFSYQLWDLGILRLECCYGKRQKKNYIMRLFFYQTIWSTKLLAWRQSSCTNLISKGSKYIPSFIFWLGKKLERYP